MRAALRGMTVLVTVFAWWVAPPPAGAQEGGALTVDDTSVVPGQAVHVQGACVPADARTVPVELREATVRLLDEFAAQPDGSFGGEVMVPVDAPTGVRARFAAVCPSGDITAEVAIIAGGLQPVGASTVPEELPVAPQAIPVGGVEAGAGGTAGAGTPWPRATGSGLAVLALLGGFVAAARRA